jgi:Family of unknown function (DUF6399)
LRTPTPTRPQLVLPHPAQPLPPSQPPTTSRRLQTAKVLDFQRARRERGLSQVEAAAEVGVRRSTLLGWQNRQFAAGLTPAQRAFFESPEGVQFLHSLHVAALFVLCLCGGLGVSMVRTLLTLTGLHTLIACSDSTLHRARRAMIAAIGNWADSQGKTLGKAMSPKDLLVALDENFHQGLMLVAMDAVSNFILVEQFADKRDAQSWADVLRASVVGWPVRIVGLLGDEAKGLIRCAREQLRVLKGSDLFHVQHEICKGASGLLRGLQSAAKAGVERAQAALDQVQKGRERDETRERRPGRPIDWKSREQAADEALDVANAEVERVEQDRERLRAEVRGLGKAYHPVNLLTGAWQTAAEVERQMQGCFERLWNLAAELNERTTSHKLVGSLTKAGAVVDSLVASVRGWQQGVEARLGALGLSQQEQEFVRAVVLPLAYLDQVAGRGADKEERSTLRAVREQVRQRALAAESPWHSWSEAVRRNVWAMVETSAALFVRASSMVEGRNGQLSLYHHRLHQLTPALLKALTAIHNYALERPDGSTAAERFFGQKHGDLFAHLVSVMGEPKRPRRRGKKEREPLLPMA